MIFMSQSGITEPARAEAWGHWYVDHLRIMVTVPGITSAQRFVTDSPDCSPSLAMYTIAGPAVFDDPYYLSVRGMGEWLELIDRRYYRRNLFAGADIAPEVADGERLIVADREQADAALADLPVIWLTCIGIDRSTPLRGIAVVGAVAVGPLSGRALAVYRPVTQRVLSGRS